MARVGNDGSSGLGLGRPCGSRTMGLQLGPGRPYKPLPTKRLIKTISLTSDDMRKFSLQGYGMNISLATVMPTKFSLSFPQSRRAASEPAAPEPRSPPEILASVSVEKFDIDVPVDTEPVRAPSPAPTEIDDPEPEVLLEALQSLNIKVRDYAYPAPPASPSSSQPPAPKVTHTPPTPATEIFDQYKGIAEFEFRLTQDPRTHPITGKSLRRLLDIGWVSMAEAKARLHQMDWEAMKEYDARDSRHPWRPCKWSVVPNTDVRQRLLLDHGGTFVHLDKMRRIMQAMRERDETERRLIEEAQERLRIMEAEREGGMGMVVGAEDDDEEEDPAAESSVAAGKKRALEHTASTPSFANSESLAGPKRAKLSGAATAPSSILNSQPSTSKRTPPLPPALVPPPKQYPAPLSSYNPQLYPEAARVIEAEDRPPLPPPREDTPPLEDEDGQDRPGHPLQRKKKGLKRTLSRTQTFRQL